MWNNKHLTSFGLKVIGVVFMVMDHIAEFFAFLHVPIWFHWLGRIVAPLFLFTSAEGFIYTRDRKKYFLRLWGGFLIMGIGNTIFNQYFSLNNEIIINNIFSTLFLGVLYMQAIEWMKIGVMERQKGVFVKGLGLFLLPILLSGVMLALMPVLASMNLFWIIQVAMLLVPSLILTEGSFLFVLLAVLFYLFHGKKWAQVLSVIAIAILTLVFGQGDWLTENYQWMMCLSVIPIILYNGEKGKSMKNFFYIFYPAHIYLFALIAFLLRR